MHFRFLAQAFEELHTLKMNRRVGISLGGSGDRILDLLVVIVAVDAVAVFVNERWVAAYHGALVSRMLNLLYVPMSILSWLLVTARALGLRRASL